MQNTQVVAVASGAIEAEILRGALEAAGFTVWLSREAAAGPLALSVGPLARVELRVPQDQAARAAEHLADLQAGRWAGDAPDPADDPGGSPFAC